MVLQVVIQCVVSGTVGNITFFCHVFQYGVTSVLGDLSIVQIRNGIRAGNHRQSRWIGSVVNRLYQRIRSWGLRKRCQGCAFQRVKIFGILGEICLGCSFDPVGVESQGNRIQVSFHDLLLGKVLLQDDGVISFCDFSAHGALTLDVGQIYVSG